MSISITNATRAYQQAARSVDAGEQAAGSGRGAEFAALIRASLKEAAHTQSQAEDTSLKGLADEADMRDVVLAVNNAESTLGVVVAVRDKMLQAYQEVIKTPI